MSERLERSRAAYAEEVREAASVRSKGLIRGFATVRREDFVGPGPWKLMRPGDMRAYQETPDDDPVHLQARVLVALDPDRRLNNGDPVSLATWLDALELREGGRFLHVGCGVGYYTAIAACALGPTGEAIGIEIDPELGARAAANLAAVPGARAEVGDGSLIALGGFDAIFINAGATRLMGEWRTALRDGGRLLVPLTVGDTPPGVGIGVMLLVTRNAGGAWAARVVSPVGIFHCAGARDPEEERALREAFNRGDPETIRSLRLGAHAPDETCWLHASAYCVSRLPPLGVVGES